MNQFLRRLYWCLSVVGFLSAAITAYDLSQYGSSLRHSAIFWLMVAGAFFFALAGWRFSAAARIKLFFALFAFLIVEIGLQAICWLGLMRSLNTKDILPWGRIYWAGEGLGNSIRNRYAWHFPEFDLARTNRIALLGDSLVEALEVRRAHNMGVVLRDRLQSADARTTVMSFGDHGSGPAQYLELMKYAHRHFGVQQVTWVISMGSDIADCSPGLQFHDPSIFICYGLATNGTVALDALGEQTRATYVRRQELRHRPVWISLPRLAVSHCMSVQLPLSVLRTRALNRRLVQEGANVNGFDAQLAQLGLRGDPFALTPSPAAREGMKIVQGIFDQAAAYAQENHLQLRIVTVPFFPPDFYAQTGPGWTTQLGNYDFFGPDRELEGWAAQRGVPFLSLGQTMRARHLTPKDIRPLYLSNGCGHFSEAGHEFIAGAMLEAFHTPKK